MRASHPPQTFRQINVPNTNVAIGTKVNFTDNFGHKSRGVVIPPDFLVPACDIARRRKIKVLAPYIKPGFVLVEYESVFLKCRASQFVAVSEIEHEQSEKEKPHSSLAGGY